MISAGIPVFGIGMSVGNHLPPAGETACPTYFAKRLIQQGGAGGFACRSNGHNQRSASKMNKFPKTVRRPQSWLSGWACGPRIVMKTGESRLHLINRSEERRVGKE